MFFGSTLSSLGLSPRKERATTRSSGRMSYKSPTTRSSLEMSHNEPTSKTMGRVASLDEFIELASRVGKEEAKGFEEIVHLERRRLNSRWLLRFEDVVTENAYRDEVVAHDIKKNVLKGGVAMLSVLAMILFPYYATATSAWTDSESEIFLARTIMSSTHAFQVILVLLFISLHYVQMSSHCLEIVITLMGVVANVSFYAADEVRVGAWTTGDGTTLLVSGSCDDDTLNLLGSVLVQVLLTSTLQPRSSRSLILSLASTPIYVIMSIPSGWSPHPASKVVKRAGTLAIVSAAIWIAQRSRELRIRIDWIRRRALEGELAALKQDEADSPSSQTTPSGAWTLRWIGEHVHDKLLCTSHSRHCDATVSLTNLDLMAWIVNASPFVVDVEGTRAHVHLAPTSFSMASIIPSADLRVRIASPATQGEDWKRLPDVVHIQLQPTDWCDNGYDNHVARLHLPMSCNGGRLGALKFVRGPNNLFLISWSPPAELRGMPLMEFEEYLQLVIDHPGDWKCTTVGEDGCPHSVIKPVGDKSRNQYDACEHFILNTVARMDASYAEARTDFGPPLLFASHVWGEEAGNTLKAIRAFADSSLNPSTTLTRRAESPVKSPNRRAGSKASCVLDTSRIWFCTCCNNQSRVAEELGNDVSISPFARVIKSSTCKHILMISPLLALSRKWCSYEFCLGSQAHKDTMLLTASGVVQAGEVAPMVLCKLASHLVNFSCAQATCTSHADASRIDQAIESMGGYVEIDAKLKATFQEAIDAAHEWSLLAKEQIVGEKRLHHTTFPMSL